MKLEKFETPERIGWRIVAECGCGAQVGATAWLDLACRADPEWNDAAARRDVAWQLREVRRVLRAGVAACAQGRAERSRALH